MSENISGLEKLAQDLGTSTGDLEKVRGSLGISKKAEYTPSELDQMKQVYEWKSQGEVKDYKEGAEKLKDLEKGGLVVGQTAHIIDSRKAIELLPTSLVDAIRAAAKARAKDFVYSDLVNASSQSISDKEDELFAQYCAATLHLYNEQVMQVMEAPEFLKFFNEAILSGKSSYQPSVASP